MASISAKITDHLAENGIINSEDKELYSYGLCQGMIMIANMLTTLVIGLVFGMLWQSVIFTIAYMPLRSYAGGYHARTQFLCNIFSVLLTIAVLLLIKYIPWTNWLCIIITFLSVALIAFLAPVEDQNKPLDSVEIRVYKKRTLCILIAETAAIIILLLFSLLQASVTISVSLFSLSIMLILGSISNHRYSQKLID